MSPENIESFFTNISRYFNASLQRSTEFSKIQKLLGISPTIIPQPAHTRWLSWVNTVTKISLKWKASKVFFDQKAFEKKPKRLIKLTDLNSSNYDEDQESKDGVTLEISIRRALMKFETFAYTLFLGTVVNHTAYVKKFEQDNFDVSNVYDVLQDYCCYYLDKLRKFEHLRESSLDDEKFEGVGV